MGKKLFRFFSDPAAKPDPNKVTVPVEEMASQSESAERMRSLLQKEYNTEQLGLLNELGHEGAARYIDRIVPVTDVIAPEPANMLKIISDQTGLRMVDLKRMPRANHKLRALIDPDRAKAMKVVPVEEREDGTLVIAIADPSNVTISDDLRLMLGREVETVIAAEDEINERVESYYGMGGETIEDIVTKEAEKAPDEDVLTTASNVHDLTDMEAIANDAPVIKLVNYLLLRAIEERASDIHIEPFPTFIRIRYRVDGVLREIPSPPRSQLISIVSRVKVMAGMNISETRLPQDGRIKLNATGREIDMRVSSVTTVHGEAIVMRVLDKNMMMIGISKIGMLPEVLADFKKLIARPNGVLLVTGPTGSGKTTTLYAALAEVRDPGEKFITTEDPVEYEMDGIQQVNINDNVGLTFGRCLRAILRQDPDTVLVGEIRDVETAQITVQAALTGHLVFSTLHTNSAAATITRLLDMGVEPFLITSALEGIIGQRLLRTICQHCKRAYDPNDEELEGFGVTREELHEQGIQLYHGEGCPECGHTGYHGRMGIFELITMTDELREMILERATTDEIHEMAVRQGMITMRQDGWVKVCMGLTTLSEVARQTPKEESTGTLPTVDQHAAAAAAAAGPAVDGDAPPQLPAGTTLALPDGVISQPAVGDPLAEEAAAKMQKNP
jgi:type II secretion system protein E